MEPIEPASYMSLPQLCSQLGISPDLASNPVMVQVARGLFGPCAEITDGQRANLAREELGGLMYQGLAPQSDVTITNHTGRRGPTHTRGWLPETIDTWAAARTQAELN